ncbi:competence/damage-inducible protein A [Lactobacillaceae bacterium 24-114]
MRVEIISVGDELQHGEISNTNSAYAAQKLSELGMDVFFQTTVGDDQQRILDSVQLAKKRADLILVCGGLGPTDDDKTLVGVAAALNEQIKFSDKWWQKIKDDLQKRKIEIQLSNKKQAQYIGKAIANEAGLALGSWYQKGSQQILILPGPSSEFRSMLRQQVLPELIKDDFSRPKKEVMHFLGRPESVLMNDLQPLALQYPQVQFLSYVKPTRIELRVIGNERISQREFKNLTSKIRKREKPYYLGSGEDFNLAIKIVDELKERQLKITGAESLTGGLFQSTICGVPGASAVFNGGFVTYAAEAKANLLHIDPSLLNKYGVVSSETASAMATHARKIMGADIGISFTGVAGPDTLEGNPPGNVWIGLAMGDHELVTKELYLAEYLGRQQIRLLTVQYGLQLILQALENNRTIVH